MSDDSKGRAIMLPQLWWLAGLASRDRSVPACSSQERPTSSRVPRAVTGGRWAGAPPCSCGGQRGWQCWSRTGCVFAEVWLDGMWPDGGARGRKSEEFCRWEVLSVLLCGAWGFSPDWRNMHGVLLPQCSQQACWNWPCRPLFTCYQPFLCIWVLS